MSVGGWGVCEFLVGCGSALQSAVIASLSPAFPPRSFGRLGMNGGPEW